MKKIKIKISPREAPGLESRGKIRGKKNTWGQSKKVAILKPRREARRNQTFQHLDLGLLASRTVRK